MKCFPRLLPATCVPWLRVAARRCCKGPVPWTMADRPRRKPFRVSIEGNIGCGKSTMMGHFAQFADVDVHMEPVDLWRNAGGHNLLNLLYEDLTRWNHTFQSYVQLTRLDIQTRGTTKKVQMFERSVQNNRFCFVEMAHKNKHLSDPEYTVLCKWYDWIHTHIDIGLDLIVYLQSTPEVVLERIRERNRCEESNISLDYLKQLHEAYEVWIHSADVPAPVLKINVDDDLPTVMSLYKENEELILGESCKLTENTEAH